MAKDKDKSSNDKKSKGSASAGASAAAAEVSKVTANPRLVAAITSYESSLAQTQSYLVTMAEIIQSEQLTKAEVVASIVEARGISVETANQQFSRYKQLFTDPETLEAVRSGEVTIKQVREAGGTGKKQANPSKEKQTENREKKFAKAVTQIVQCAKEGGMDIQTILNTVKAALKKGGVK